MNIGLRFTGRLAVAKSSLLVGHDDEKGEFMFQNSWGKVF
jgi:hypothetical protein